ncbi:MAG: FHA domain-containing protein [Deltaproteobacteria bacterium]|nr:FHA domain-containing protein [Deltaproteobacteria bacterium]
MPTAMGSDESAGAIVVRWSDASGGGAAIFREEFFIGRGAECRVRFYDPLVSRKHARVYPDDGIWMIEDLGSRNGTQLDAHRIEKPMALAEAAMLRINEAGPTLRLEQVAAGPAYRAALIQIGDGSAVAHVRGPALAPERPRGVGPGRS